MTIDVHKINEKLVDQDKLLRWSVLEAQNKTDTQRMLEALVAIHERLGNLIYFNLMTGGR